MTSPITLPVRDGEGEPRIDRFLRRKFDGLTQGKIEQMIRKGLIRIDGERVKKASHRLSLGNEIIVPGDIYQTIKQAKESQSKIDDATQELIKSLVIYQDDDVIILNKPAGLAVQGGSKMTHHLDELMEVFNHPEFGRPKLAHRLDKDTSGIIAFGRTPEGTAKLAKSFADRKTKKIYWALVLGVPHPLSGEIRGFMKKAGSKFNADLEKMRRAAHGDKDALFAITDYEVISNAGTKVSWVALRPVTGRTHQLRFHMAEIGTSIIGDKKYTCDRPVLEDYQHNLFLHARALQIPHPKGGEIKVIAPLPKHFKDAFSDFGFSENESKNPFLLFEK